MPPGGPDPTPIDSPGGPPGLAPLGALVTAERIGPVDVPEPLAPVDVPEPLAPVDVPEPGIDPPPVPEPQPEPA